MKKVLDILKGIRKYLKEILEALPQMSEQSGYSRLYILWEFFKCYVLHRVNLGVFRSLKMYNFSSGMILSHLSYRQCKRISDRLNAQATEEDMLVLNDKHLFNRRFAGFVSRDWLYIPDSTPEQVRQFIAGHDAFLLKLCESTQGAGISRFQREAVDPEAFLMEYAGKPYMLESIIRQHPVLAAVNPSSVNTVRMIAARKDDRVLLVGAGLRCGGSGQFVDNFHHGGAAYPIDLETGIITGRGIDLYGNPILRHPTTGHVMPGLQIPHWDALVELVERATLHATHIGYIGWDLAVTPEGVEIIEGNINYPGTTVIQLDGPGPYARLKKFLKETGA